MEELKRAPNSALMRPTNGDYDYLVKLLALGDSAVGKTSLLSRFVTGTFTSSLGATIGLDFFEKKLMRNGSRVSLQLWDTSGQERFRSLTSSIFRNAYGFLVVFDVTNEKSFTNVRDWLHKLREQVAVITEEPDVILVGNKMDLHDDSDEEMVNLDRVQNWADEHHLKFIPTSARTGAGVQDAFNALIDVVMATMEKQLQHKLSLRDLSEQSKPGCSC